ncbi:hypothetical protein NDU88_000693 [Pleurodeles waltl]|uniref:Uncharacterized protein n=1 Tax=Pleurodeles waltl TaxID=8319 RepID=A0AAV7LW97_PLEWA|nr:hypothetical protein NDU88_000693 [Pleurodeles waltl]
MAPRCPPYAARVQGRLQAQPQQRGGPRAAVSLLRAPGGGRPGAPAPAGTRAPFHGRARRGGDGLSRRLRRAAPCPSAPTCLLPGGACAAAVGRAQPGTARAGGASHGEDQQSRDRGALGGGSSELPEGDPLPRLGSPEARGVHLRLGSSEASGGPSQAGGPLRLVGVHLRQGSSKASGGPSQAGVLRGRGGPSQAGVLRGQGGPSQAGVV